MFGIFLVMVVALVGGLIAFVGDRVGMRVGRKRLTLFGIRPKYTSIAIAVLTGILTAVATLGILSAASENVRIAVFHLTQTLRNLDQATARNLKLKAEYDRVNAARLEVTDKWRAAQAELDGINEKIAYLSGARHRAESALAAASAELSKTASDLTQAKEQYAQAMADLTAAKKEIEFVQQRKDNLESAIAILENQIESLSTQREYLGTGVVDFATQPIILHLGEVLVAGVVEPGRSFDELEGMVSEMLRRADRLARDRGATIENKNIGTKVDVLRWSEAYQLLFDLEGPAVLRVVSGTNTIAGRPAFVYLEVLPDKVAFQAGEVVARIIVNSQDSLDQIFASLVGELLPAARKAAETAGMVSANGGTPVPELPFASLREAATQAMALEGAVEIRLVATRDLKRAGDSLALAAVVEKK
ncbi:MAG: DUF3084 domain-containing protein [Bacteroidota bacterium]